MWEEKDAEQHLDNLLDIRDAIKAREITIITGSNGSGKSLIRKTLAEAMSEQLGTNPDKTVASVSMQLRTESRPEFSALGGMMHDTSWTPTSKNTWSLIKGLLKQCEEKYIVIDEPELGCSEEIQLAIVNKLNDWIMVGKELDNFKGCLVITHSKIIVNSLIHDKFINLNGMSEEQWVNRTIVAGSLEELDNNSKLLHRTIQNRINANKNKK